MTDTLWGLPARELARLVKTREVSAEEVVRTHLERLQQVEPALDAFLHVGAEAALKRARKVDGLLSNLDPGPLAGVPLAVKDVLNVEGAPRILGFSSALIRSRTPTKRCLTRCSSLPKFLKTKRLR